MDMGKLKNHVAMKTKAKVRAKVFSVSTLTSTCILILTLFVCFLPEDALAGPSQERTRMMRMPKYSLFGDITLQYEDENTKNGWATDHKNMFTQNFRLNFRSYVISPRIMYYTINTGFGIRTGTLYGYEKGTTKSYGIDTVFFPDKPFSFSLRASENDEPDHKYTSYGLSMTYSRKVKRIRPVRPAAPPEGEENTNLNKNGNANLNKNGNANLNKNANLNANTNEEGNTNENVAKPKLEKKPPSSNGFFYDILPHVTMLNIDRNDSKYKSGIESKWDRASLRFMGNYGNTGYGLDFDYDVWTRDKTSHKGYGSELRTDTRLKWSFFQRFENYIYYRKNDITLYNINSSLTGETKKWIYGIYANYFSAAPSASGSASGSARQYSITTDVSNKTPYIYKGINLFYGMGLGFERLSNNKDDLFANGRLGAKKRIGANTDLNSSLSLRGGTQGSVFDFSTGISYTFRPRKGYVVSIELDPQGNTLKTRAFKPQVSGWDYSIRTGYTFGVSRDTRENQPINTVIGRVTTNKTLISHRADLNVNVYLSILTLSSDAYLYYSNLGKRFEWNNSIYATVMRKIGVTIGTGLRVDMPESGTKTTNYNIYNLITYRLSRTALLRLDSRYTKTMPADTTTMEITPSLSWAWRRVLVDLEVRLKTAKTSNGAETKERRIMLRVARPFNIL